MYSVQNSSLKLIFYQKEVKNNENCPFLMINVKKNKLEWCLCFYLKNKRKSAKE